MIADFLGQLEWDHERVGARWKSLSKGQESSKSRKVADLLTDLRTGAGQEWAFNVLDRSSSTTDQASGDYGMSGSYEIFVSSTDADRDDIAVPWLDVPGLIGLMSTDEDLFVEYRAGSEELRNVADKMSVAYSQILQQHQEAVWPVARVPEGWPRAAAYPSRTFWLSDAHPGNAEILEHFDGDRYDSTSAEGIVRLDIWDTTMDEIEIERRQRAFAEQFFN